MPIRITVSFLALALLSACRDAPIPYDVAAHPDDPTVPSARERYRPVGETMRNYRIVAPQPWEKSNEQVTPKAKP